MARPPADLLTLVRRHRMIDVARALLGFAGMRMKDTQLQEVASSMTLTTLLSLIPLLAVSLAAFAAFPSFAEYRQELEAMVFNSFLPPQESETIVEYIRQFSAHASGLGIFGLAGLALTALLLIDKFFVTVNRIFKVRRMRPWSQRAVLYWAILTLAPTLIALRRVLPRLDHRDLPDSSSGRGLRRALQARPQLLGALQACARRRHDRCDRGVDRA